MTSELILSTDFKITIIVCIYIHIYMITFNRKFIEELYLNLLDSMYYFIIYILNVFFNMPKFNLERII